MPVRNDSRCRPIFVSAAYYVLTGVAYLPPGLRPVLDRTGAVATGVPMVMVDAPQTHSSRSPEFAVARVGSFVSEFGQLGRG